MACRNLWLAALLASSALCVVSGAAAQDSGAADTAAVPEELGPEELGMVTVRAGFSELPNRDEPYVTPAAVEWVDAEEIETFRSTSTLNDLFRSLPGVFTWQDGQQPGVAVNIRGLEGFGRVTTMIDGVRQNFRFVSHAAGGYTYVDPNLLAGISINKGAVSTAGGAGTLAGAVNFRTIGIDDVVDADDSWGFQTTQMLGTNGADWSGMAAGGMRSDLGGAIAGSSIFGAVSGASGSDYEDGNGTLIPNTGEGLVSGLVKLNLAPNEDHSLQISGMWYNNDFAANSYNQTIENNTYVLNYAYRPDNPWVNLAVNGYLNDLTMNYDGAITSGSYGERVIEDLGIGFDITNTSTFSLSPIGVSIDYGFEYFHDKVTTEDGGVNPSGNEGVGGVYTQTTFSYSIVDVIVGLRYDFFNLSGEAASPSAPPGITPPADGVTDLDQSEGKFSPKFTVAVTPLNWLQLYGTYEWTFRPPTPSEALFGGVHPEAGGGFEPVFYPNPNLKPERGKGFEFGANVLYKGLLLENDGLRLKADYYRTRIEDYITTVCQTTGTSSFPFFAMGCWFDNAPGTSVISGVELEAHYDLGFAYAGISYTNADSDLPTGDGAGGMGEVSYLPDNYFTIDMGVRLLDQRLVLGARMNDVSESLVNDQTGETTAGYTTFDLYGSYQVFDSLSFFFTASNLTNVEYTPALSQTAAAGRTLVAGGTLRF